MLVTMLYGPIYASVQELTPLRIRSSMIAVLIVGLMLLGASLGGPLAWLLAEKFDSSRVHAAADGGHFRHRANWSFSDSAAAGGRAPLQPRFGADSRYGLIEENNMGEAVIVTSSRTALANRFAVRST